jgi:hypothetical protein
MSVWADIHKRSNGSLIRKEDVDTEIASSLASISYELDTRNPCFVKVFSMDEQGRTFTNIVECQIVKVYSRHEAPGLTLNIEWNINRIKSVIFDRRFISLEKG